MSREIFKEILADVGAEMSRLGTQGQMEMASAIFNGDGFVPYGPGQITPEPPQEQATTVEPQIEELDHGREM